MIQQEYSTRLFVVIGGLKTACTENETWYLEKITLPLETVLDQQLWQHSIIWSRPFCTEAASHGHSQRQCDALQHILRSYLPFWA
jgi:hypothetical protein